MSYAVLARSCIIATIEIQQLNIHKMEDQEIYFRDSNYYYSYHKTANSLRKCSVKSFRNDSPEKFFNNDHPQIFELKFADEVIGGDRKKNIFASMQAMLQGKEFVQRDEFMRAWNNQLFGLGGYVSPKGGSDD